MKTFGLERLTRAKVERTVQEAWDAAGEDINRPFSDKAQRAYARIAELNEALRSADVPLPSDMYLRLFQAQVYGEQDYRGVIGFMEWARDRLASGECGDFSRAVFDDGAFLELYFTARIMDPHSVEMVRILRRPFIRFYVDFLFESGKGEREMKKAFCGDRQGCCVEILARRLVANSNAFISFFRRKGRHDEALVTLDNILTFRWSERIGGMSLKSVFWGGTDELLDLRLAIMAEKARREGQPA